MSLRNYGIRLPPLKDYLLKKKIDNLPDEIQKYIFEFIKLDVWYNEFLKLLYCTDCAKLNYKILRPWIPRILANSVFTNMCIHKIKHFDTVWKSIKKENKKNFKNMSKGNDFALSLLMYIYH
jgi:hypothetical protein